MMQECNLGKARGHEIEPHHLPASLAKPDYPESEPVMRTNKEFLLLKKKLREETTKGLEREFILGALQRADWNVTRAAQAVGIQRTNLQAMMRKHGIRSRHNQ